VEPLYTAAVRLLGGPVMGLGLGRVRDVDGVCPGLALGVLRLHRGGLSVGESEVEPGNELLKVVTIRTVGANADGLAYLVESERIAEKTGFLIDNEHMSGLSLIHRDLFFKLFLLLIRSERLEGAKSLGVATTGKVVTMGLNILHGRPDDVIGCTKIGLNRERHTCPLRKTTSRGSWRREGEYWAGGVHLRDVVDGDVGDGACGGRGDHCDRYIGWEVAQSVRALRVCGVWRGMLRSQTRGDSKVC